MAEVRFYICDVCGAEIQPNVPCHMAYEVSEPVGYVYLSASEMHHHKAKYVCSGCLPLQRFRPIDPKKPNKKNRLVNAFREWLDEWG